MSDNVYDRIILSSRMIINREDELGSPAQDGPSAQQADSLCQTISFLVSGRDSFTPAELWDAFRASVEMEMSWLFPEKDPIAEHVLPALKELQNISGTAIESVMPDQHAALDSFVSSAIVSNAAKRAIAVDGNGLSWRMVLAGGLKYIGMRGLAIAIANKEIERWQNSGK